MRRCLFGCRRCDITTVSYQHLLSPCFRQEELIKLLSYGRFDHCCQSDSWCPSPGTNANSVLVGLFCCSFVLALHHIQCIHILQGSKRRGVSCHWSLSGKRWRARIHWLGRVSDMKLMSSNAFCVLCILKGVHSCSASGCSSWLFCN